MTNQFTAHRVLRPALAGLLLVVLTVSVYLPVRDAGFVWDDAEYVVDNPLLRTADGLRRIWTEPRAQPQYYPLTFTTFWLEYRLWGLQPAGYHLVNVALHALNVVLVWRILRRLRVPGAWWAAAVFAVHPMQVESVAWVTERKNVLSGALGFGALLAVLRATALDRSVRPSPIAWPRYLAGCLLFAAALLSKTTMCVLPALLLVVVWWQRGSIDRRSLALTVPLFALGAFMAATTVWVEARYVGGGEWERALAERVLAAGRTFWFYPWTLVWPRQLAFIYPRWEINAGVWWQYLFPAAACGVVAAGWLLRGRIGRGPVAAVLGYAAALAPVSGFFSLYFMRYTFVADRFVYLPGVPLIALATALAAQGMRRLAGRAPALPAVVGALIVAGLVVGAVQRLRVYHTPRALWEDTLAKNPGSWLAHNNLGVLLERDGEVAAAVAHYEVAVRLQPTYPETYLNMGNALLAQGRTQEAISWYRLAIQVHSEYPMAYHNLGLALARLGRFDEAIAAYGEALRQAPEYVEVHNSLGAVWQMRGDLAQAAAAYADALRLRPDFPEAHYNLGTALAAQGRMDEASEQFAVAIRLRPEYPDAYVGVGNLFRAQGRREQARAQYHAALRIRPEHPDAHNGLGVLLAEQGRIAEAERHFEAAAQADPANAEARSNLGNALLARGALGEAVVQYEAALALRPGSAETHNNLGMALQAQGRIEAAIAHFEQAVNARPDLLTAHNNLANALLHAGRARDAVRHYEEVLRLDPADTEARRQLEVARQAEAGSR